MFPEERKGVACKDRSTDLRFWLLSNYVHLDSLLLWDPESVFELLTPPPKKRKRKTDRGDFNQNADDGDCSCFASHAETDENRPLDIQYH